MVRCNITVHPDCSHYTFSFVKWDEICTSVTLDAVDLCTSNNALDLKFC